MKAFVDRGICIGCEACAGTCPEVFSMDDDGLAVAINDDIPSDIEDSAVEARDSCPVDAIDIKE